MTTAAGITGVPSVEGELSYLAPESTVLRRFTAPGRSVNTGVYRTYAMLIHNGRMAEERFTIDRNGFALVNHRSAVRDFTDCDEVDRVWVPEVAEFVKGVHRCRPGGDEELGPASHPAGIWPSAGGYRSFDA